MVKVSALVAGILLVSATAMAQDSTWQVEQVDATGVGEFSSLKVDKLGNVHVAYVVNDNANYPLKYAFRDHALKRWFIMTIDLAASFSSLALDSKGRPHISWADHGTGSGAKLKYAYWDGKFWRKQVVPLSSDVVGYYTSIALDQNDHPSISFYEYRGPAGGELKNRMRNAAWNGRMWEVRTIDGAQGAGKFNCIASDPAGNMHLAYANVGEEAGIRYAYWDGRSWKAEILEGLRDAGGYVGYSSCLTVDKDANPHLTYMDMSKNQLKYAVRQDGHWRIQAVDAVRTPAYPDRNSIVVDDAGRPYLGYYDAGGAVLKIAFQEGDRWLSRMVDAPGAGFTSSMDIHEGVLWVSYSDQSRAGVRVARIDLQALRTNPNGAGPTPETAVPEGPASH